MNDISKLLIWTGVGLIGLGIIFFFLNKIPGGWRMPGDIAYEKGDFKFFFPLGACILLSLLLSLIMFLFNRH